MPENEIMNKLTESEIEYIISRVLDNANEAAESTDKSQFSEGKKLAYYEILDTIKNELIVRDIDVKSVCYASKSMKGLADSENPLDSVNRIHCLLKMFLNAHSGFSRDDLQNYLNLYSFVINPPADHLEKVEKIIKMVFENPKSLRYREQFG